MIIGIPKETKTREKRVAISPEIANDLIKKGFKIQSEKDAGLASFYNNESYTEIGVTIVSYEEVYKNSDIILKVNAPL